MPLLPPAGRDAGRGGPGSRRPRGGCAGEIAEHHPQVEANERRQSETTAHEHDRVSVRPRREHQRTERCDLDVVGLGRRGQQRSRRLGQGIAAGEQGAVAPQHRTFADVDRQRTQVGERVLRREGVCHCNGADYPAVPLSRIAWLTTVALCLVIALLLLLSGYLGYAGVLLAIGLSAAINLR